MNRALEADLKKVFGELGHFWNTVGCVMQETKGDWPGVCGCIFVWNVYPTYWYLKVKKNKSKKFPTFSWVWFVSDHFPSQGGGHLGLLCTVHKVQ